MSRPLTYRGQDRRGVARGGRSTSMTPAELAANLYTNRWRWAQIQDDTGDVVAEVNQLNGRTWWAHS